MPKDFSARNRKKNRNNKNKTRKQYFQNNIHSTNNSSNNSNKKLDSFQKEITVRFLEVLLMVKLFHWKTHSYATHKATDEVYEKLNTNIDSFIEILLGKTGDRVNLTETKTIRLIDFTSQESFKREIESFKNYLVSLSSHPGLKVMTNTDLFNIRDTILGDMNQLLYLLTFR